MPARFAFPKQFIRHRQKKTRSGTQQPRWDVPFGMGDVSRWAGSVPRDAEQLGFVHL